MPRRARLDAELVRRGLARSRGEAAELVTTGRVRVAGQEAQKVASQVDPAVAIVVAGVDAQPGYVSRGAHKLAGALEHWGASGPVVEGRRCLDAGASTGGFTDVLLRRGATQVVAVDVGYGQIAWSLRTDPRVVVVERTNVRDLDPAVVGKPVDMVVADLSFIPLGLVLPALVSAADSEADFLLMVKPQFEVGREAVGPGGVVRDPMLRSEAVTGVAGHGARLGLGVRGVVASSLPGPSGNVEYFLWMRRGAPALEPGAVERAVAAGPR